ncbi:hypothetical protein [Vibrio gallaecicus]|uniref:hypothetical protein n=1 Tax=Vibrio gallaecicus TaxID=552386 RepID=UPI0025B29A0D|nr:hypothetical protein [Vibrio gallaecicus]MDN3615956.1 hypothetical protein [Vibrio gallaecicus]
MNHCFQGETRLDSISRQTKAHEELLINEKEMKMKKMRRAQLHRVRIQYWKDTAKEVAKK